MVKKSRPKAGNYTVNNTQIIQITLLKKKYILVVYKIPDPDPHLFYLDCQPYFLYFYLFNNQ